MGGGGGELPDPKLGINCKNEEEIGCSQSIFIVCHTEGAVILHGSFICVRLEVVSEITPFR